MSELVPRILLEDVLEPAHRLLVFARIVETPRKRGLGDDGERLEAERVSKLCDRFVMPPQKRKEIAIPLVGNRIPRGELNCAEKALLRTIPILSW